MYWQRRRQTYAAQHRRGNTFTTQRKQTNIPNGKDLSVKMLDLQSVLYILIHSRGLLRHRPYHLLSPQHNGQADIRQASWPLLGTFLLRNVNNIRVAWGVRRQGKWRREMRRGIPHSITLSILPWNSGVFSSPPVGEGLHDPKLTFPNTIHGAPCWFEQVSQG